MPAAWPTGSFPFITDPENYQEDGPRGNLIRSPMERGTTKQRRRFTKVSRLVSGATEIMTLAQTEAFEDWYRDTLKGGALPFTAANPRTGVVQTFKFTDGYSIVTLLDDSMRVAMKLEQEA